MGNRYDIRRTWCFEKCGATFITMSGLINHLKREHGQQWRVKDVRPMLGDFEYLYQEERPRLQ